MKTETPEKESPKAITPKKERQLTAPKMELISTSLEELGLAGKKLARISKPKVHNIANYQVGTRFAGKFVKIYRDTKGQYPNNNLLVFQHPNKVDDEGKPVEIVLASATRIDNDLEIEQVKDSTEFTSPFLNKTICITYEGTTPHQTNEKRVVNNYLIQEVP